ncbi:MAG: hydrogenase [Kiritimatiellae bacterium]|nr:hydrogenase [Kiritimatiellia bacterium]
MWNIFKARTRQKYRTYDYPRLEPVLPEMFRGRPVLDGQPLKDAGRVVQSCPTGALSAGKDKTPRLDMGLCIFCGQCEKACSGQGIKFSREHSLAARRRADLVLAGKEQKLADALEKNTLRLFGRSLKLRQVSAGGCNACEADVNVLNTPAFDLGRFGIQFVASPRHADGLLITGPVTKNMELALQKTYAAVPEPKIVIAAGACAISGGIFAGHKETCRGADSLLKTDLLIPGCPPHPWTIMDGLLRLLGKL